ncbi:MAG: type 2 isopentenyl-diphosphate Delta-isomerase [Acidobacteria bacterium]|nr:type 2 isopentenyl-diphosphate Delta-isomerase [Acidobacteriota bacterium]
MSGPPEIDVIRQRKLEGLTLPLEKNVQARTTSTFLEYVTLIHNALPELDLDEIDTSTTFLNHQFSAPLIIDCMTGGTPEAAQINRRLAETAAALGLGMGLGSQRAGLKNKDLAGTYSIARKLAPSAFLMANIGAAQLAAGLTASEVMQIVDMIEANALVIHLNPLQELVQPEGEAKFKGVWVRIAELANRLTIPVVVKEVGAGISGEVAVRLEQAGVRAVNVAGSGGTSWAGVEKLRAESARNELKTHLGEVFWDWGLPTAASLIEVRRSVGLELIASGGLRNGVEAAKCLSLGAGMCAMAFPFLKRAAISTEAVMEFARLVLHELTSVMFLTGSKDIAALKTCRYVLTGPLADWVERAPPDKR